MDERVARIVGRVLARELGFAAYGLGWQALSPLPGFTDRLHRATAAAGAAIARHIVDAYEKLVESVLVGDAQSPAPVMAWVTTLTAIGRLSPSAA